MSRNTIHASVILAAMAVALALMAPAGAQQNNRPFSFGNSSSGMGMSTGGRQAILNQKIMNSAPDNLLRGPNGELVDVTRGPGNSAIVSFEGGGFIPEYHGTGFRGDNASMQAGIFNPYFIPRYAGSSYGEYDYSQFQTAAIINAWVGAVAAGNMPAAFYGAGNSVDFWTGY